MTGDPAPYLIDSNILLRLAKYDRPEDVLVRAAVKSLGKSGTPMFYTIQNMAEFWNASTRPVDKNGFGLSVREADLNARECEDAFTFLPDTEAVYREWRRLVIVHEVKGVQVHDARLVASMRTYSDVQSSGLQALSRCRGGASRTGRPNPGVRFGAQLC